MVVTRRAPVAPTSRTPSSNAVPRAAAARLRKDGASYTRAEGTNGDVDDALSKKYRREKPKKKGKKKKALSLADVLFRWLLLFFTIYSVAVCPSDVQHQSAVCRGLAEYRRLVLEPYLLPPIHAALSHPSVAPYVHRVEPYATRAIAFAQATHHQVTARAVPLWTDKIYPVIEPQYTKFVAPYVEKAHTAVSPYVARACAEYEKHVEPQVNRAIAYAIKTQQFLAPYARQAAFTAHKYYVRAKPYLAALWLHTKRGAARALVFAREQRKTFVDPHVERIWEKVKELSQGAPAQGQPKVKIQAQESKVVSKVPTVATPKVGEQTVFSVQDKLEQFVRPEVVPEPEPEVVVETVSKVEEPAVEATPTAVVESTSPTAESTSSTPTDKPAPSSIPEPTPSVIEELSPSVAPVVTSSSESSAASVSVDVPVAVPSPVDAEATEPALEAARSVLETTSSTEAVPEPTPSVAESSVTEVSAPTPTPAADPLGSDDIDLDAFYAELGLNDGESRSANAPPPPEPTPTLTAEEQAALEAERKAAIAEKRADIVARHAAWEVKLDNLVKDHKKALRKALVSMRKNAAALFKADEGVKGLVDDLVTEAERFLNGAEAYLKKLKKEEGERAGVWERVLGRVDERFTERLREVEGKIGGWYEGYLQGEEAEISTHAMHIKEAADAAQADVGLDYVWLEDVTYHDWQRYHDLMRRYERFVTDAQTIQNGTHPSPPINPIEDALKELESEVSDIVLGFETRARRLRRAGIRAFGKSETYEEEEAEEGDGDEELDEEEQKLLNDPEVVKILPVPEEIPQYAESVVVGRGKVEVEEALKRAEAVQTEQEAAAESVAAKSAHEEL